MKQKKRPIGKLLMGLLIVFFYLPIIFMIVFSFNESKSLTHFTGWSLHWYEKMFRSREMMDSLSTTLAVALIATAVSTALGTISAIGLSKSRKIVQRIIMQINDFPLMNPEIVTAIGLMLLFITFRVERGFMTMLLAHIAFCTPYVILSVMPKIRSLDPNLADAAMDLGATPWKALTSVIVPEIMPGIVSGALIAFTMSFDDFIISYFVTGRGVKNLSIMVYTMSKRVNPSINAISSLVVLLITVVLVLVNVIPLLRGQRSGKAEQSRAERGKAGVNGRGTDGTEDKQGPASRNYAPAGAAALLLLCAAGIGLYAFGGGSDGPYAGETLHVYNWGEYTGDNLIPDFEAMTGAKVVMDNFDSNEQMYIKVANGDAFDILVPSDYMIERLIGEDRLQKLDQSKITVMDELADGAKDLPYDPGNEYSVPWYWGTVGIVYDKTKVSEEDLEREGFNIFLDERYKDDIYLYDSERDSFMMALKALGYSMNTSDEAELQEAYEWLLQCVTTMKPEIVMDEIIDNMAQGRKALGLVYSGDATYIIDENPDIGYFLPESGTNLWTDAMVIPQNASNTELAYEFINYVAGYEGSMDNALGVGYTPPNIDVMEELSGPEGDYEGINAFLPRSDNPNDEIFHYDEETRKIIADLWSRVKIAASNAG